MDLSRWERGKSVNWGNRLVNKWEKGDPCLKTLQIGLGMTTWSVGDVGLNNITNNFSGWQHWLFQVWSPRVPPDNLAMPRPTQCRRGLRRSFCCKNPGTGPWARLRGESSARAWNCKQQQQKWDRPAAALPVKTAVISFQTAAFKAVAVMRCELEQCQIVRWGGEDLT